MGGGLLGVYHMDLFGYGFWKHKMQAFPVQPARWRPGERETTEETESPVLLSCIKYGMLCPCRATHIPGNGL